MGFESAPSRQDDIPEPMPVELPQPAEQPQVPVSV